MAGEDNEIEDGADPDWVGPWGPIPPENEANEADEADETHAALDAPGPEIKGLGQGDAFAGMDREALDTRRAEASRLLKEDAEAEEADEDAARKARQKQGHQQGQQPGQQPPSPPNGPPATPHANTPDNDYELSFLGWLYQVGPLHIRDGGGYLSIHPHAGKKDLTDRQLRAMILNGVLDKGWTTLYFYKDRTHIDPQLTARANAMIDELKRSGMPLHGMDNVHANPVRRMLVDPQDPKSKTYVEPWNDGPLRGIWHRAVRPVDNGVCTMRHSFSCAMKAVLSSFSLGMQYHKITPCPQNQNQHPPQTPPAGGGTSP